MPKPKNLLYQTNNPLIDIESLDVGNLNFTIIGKRGYGKTTMARRLIEQVKRKSIVIFDAMGEYSGDYSFTNFSELSVHGQNNGLRFNKKYVCRFESDEDYEDLFFLISNLQNVFVVVEEADLYCKPQFIDPFFSQIIKYGRHRNIYYLGISRRTAEVNNLIISQSHYAISFRQSLPIDVDKLQKYGFTENIQNLPVFHYEMIEI